MLHLLLILNFIIICSELEARKDLDADSDLGGNLITRLNNDKNLDLSEDEEYEDLRAEYLAYHTALASLASSASSASSDGRRSLLSTPCWRLGGICINYNLCIGFRSLSEIPGCKDKLKVCCFAWNKYNVRDWAHEGIGSLAMPWSYQQEFGGKGVLDVEVKEELKPKKKKSHKTTTEPTELAERKKMLRMGLGSDDDDMDKIAIIIRRNK